MRDIKFRAWFNNIMINTMSIQEMIHQKVNTIPLKTLNNEVIFMQYTGLKDKNGKKIYEGDIIKYDFNKLNYRIEFVNAEFIARRFYENIENLYPTEFDYGKECEVIGNIYENRELIE